MRPPLPTATEITNRVAMDQNDRHASPSAGRIVETDAVDGQEAVRGWVLLLCLARHRKGEIAAAKSTMAVAINAIDRSDMRLTTRVHKVVPAGRAKAVTGHISKCIS